MGTKIKLTTSSPTSMDQSYRQFYKEKIEREKNTKKEEEKNQCSSSFANFSMEEHIKTLQPPKYKYPELEQLPTETLIAIHEGRCRSASMQRTKARYFIDKRNGFPNNTYLHYRHLLGINLSAHHYLGPDGKVDIENLIRKYPGGEGEEGCCGEGICGYDEEEYADFSDEDSDVDSEEDDVDSEEEDADSEEDGYGKKETKLNPLLLGKQFLLKFIEVEKIEADLKKASVEMAQWAIYKHCGLLADSIFFLKNCLFINVNVLLNDPRSKTSVTILEANKQQATQVWEISSDVNKDAGKVSFQHHSANSPYTFFLQDLPDHTRRYIVWVTQSNQRWVPTRPHNQVLDQVLGGKFHKWV